MYSHMNTNLWKFYSRIKHFSGLFLNTKPICHLTHLEKLISLKSVGVLGGEGQVTTWNFSPSLLFKTISNPSIIVLFKILTVGRYIKRNVDFHFFNVLLNKIIKSTIVTSFKWALLIDKPFPYQPVIYLTWGKNAHGRGCDQNTVMQGNRCYMLHVWKHVTHLER